MPVCSGTSRTTALMVSPTAPFQNAHGPTSITIVSSNECELEHVTRTVICTPQSVGLAATTLPMTPTKFLRGLLMLVSGQFPKGYVALHTGHSAGAASALW